MNKFPQNIKEAVIASVPNCLVMVIGMMSLNLWIYDALTVSHFLSAFPKIFLTAFLLDFFIVGPIVMRFVRRHNIIKFMPFFRVGMMAGILTLVAPILETGYVPDFSRYCVALPRSYIAALLLQVFVAMRFGLFVLSIWRKHISK